MQIFGCVMPGNPTDERLNTLLWQFKRKMLSVLDLQFHDEKRKFMLIEVYDLCVFNYKSLTVLFSKILHFKFSYTLLGTDGKGFVFRAKPPL